MIYSLKFNQGVAVFDLNKQTFETYHLYYYVSTYIIILYTYNRYKVVP